MAEAGLSLGLAGLPYYLFQGNSREPAEEREVTVHLQLVVWFGSMGLKRG